MKILSTALVSTLLAATAVPAMALDDISGFYIGLNGRIDQVVWKDKTFSATYRKSTLGVPSSTIGTASATDLPEAPMGAGVSFGYRFSPYFAVDGGFGTSSDSNRIEDRNDGTYYYRTSIRQWQLDGYAYWPLGQSGRFRPFATAGMAYSSLDARLDAVLPGTDSSRNSVDTSTLTPYIRKHELDWRIGAGLEVGISEDVSSRLYVRYQPYSFGGLSGGATMGFDINVLVF